MVHFRGEPLFPARVRRLGKSPADIAGNDGAFLAQLSQGPGKIDNGKAAILPIGHDFVGAQRIKIDRDVNIRASKTSHELFEMLAPIFSQNRAATLSIFRRPIVGPGMDFELARAFCPAVAENLLRPPAFEISAAPDADFLNVRKFERTVHPTATAPFWRAHIPVGMVVEGNKNGWLRQTPGPKRSKMVKITRAVKKERRELRLILAIKFLD